MSFLSTTFSIPLWFLIFALACAAPLWIKWSKLAYKKLIKSDFFKKKFSDFDDSADEEISIFQKATDNWKASVEQDLKTAELKKSKRKHEASSIHQPYVKIVLKTLALNGDAGMLIQSIADELEIKRNEIKSTLSYLEENEFVEAVETGSSTKYYLAARGKRYCIKRGYIAE